MGQVISTAMKTVNKGMAWFTDPWLRVGNRVEVNFKGYGKWYPGKIGEVAKGKYTINYDDGDVELVSDLARIRREPGPNDCDLFGKRYSAGAEVMARWGGGAAWYPATIQSVDEVRRYTVEYEDGETEKLPSSSLKARTTQSADVPSAQFGWVVGKAYAIARPVIEPILKPIRELLEKPIELGDALSINYRNAGTMYTAKVIGIETASPTAPFPIRVKYDDDQEKQTIEYADRHLIKRSSGAADSDLGYSYTILRPSALRLREAFESEDTHRFRSARARPCGSPTRRRARAEAPRQSPRPRSDSHAPARARAATAAARVFCSGRARGADRRAAHVHRRGAPQRHGPPLRRHERHACG
jgi:hypothetical protein